LGSLRFLSGFDYFVNFTGHPFTLHLFSGSSRSKRVSP
jgi:hypothetical protein